MTRDWESAARNGVTETLDDVRADVGELTPGLIAELEETRETLLADDFERSEGRDQTAELRDALVGAAHTLLDCANEVEKFRSGATLRNLEGKEPVGYSKRDGGGTHDALYGSKAQSRAFARAIRWPLDLSEWDKEKATRTRRDIEPVSAEGTSKFTKNVGGRTVHLVVDSRGREPF